jgi:hypothetical protein
MPHLDRQAIDNLPFRRNYQKLGSGPDSAAKIGCLAKVLSEKFLVFDCLKLSLSIIFGGIFGNLLL